MHASLSHFVYGPTTPLFSMTWAKTDPGDKSSGANSSFELWSTGRNP